MAEDGKRMTKMQMADAVYDRVMAKKQELETLQKNIDDTAKLAEQYDSGMHESVKLMKGSKDLTEEQKQMIKEVEEAFSATKSLKKLEADIEKVEKEIKTHEQNIINALATYIEDTEKEINNVTAQKEKYNEFISKEKEEYEALKTEIDELVAQNDPANNDVIEAKKKKLSDKEKDIAGYEEKLKSYDDSMEKINAEFEAYKNKYKELWDKAQEKIIVTDTPVENTDGPEINESAKPEEVTNGQEQGEETADEDAAKNGEEVEPENDSDKDKGNNKPRRGKGEQVIYGGQPANNEAPEEGKEEQESDFAAYTRISKLLLDEKTRNKVEEQDINRILEVLGNERNYKKIATHKPIFGVLGKSQAQKVFAQLGRIVSSKVNRFVGDKNTRMEITQELTDWDNMIAINEFSEETLAEGRITELEESGISEEDMEAFELAKGQLGNYRRAVNTLSKVRVKRKDYRKDLLKALPKGRDEKAPEEPTTKGMDLDKQVNSDEEVKEYMEERDQQEVITSDTQNIDIGNVK